MNKRKRQINTLLEKELSLFLNEEVELPEGVIVTVSAVRVSSDLRHARVYVSVFPFGKKISVLERLNKKKTALQRLLRSRVRFKFLPKLSFELDTTEEEASHVDRLLDQIGEDSGT